MPIGRSMEGNQSFLWQKIMIYELRECRVDRLHEAKDKNHYAAVLNQALNDNQVIVFSDSSLLTNIYDYSFTIPEIRIDLKTSRTNTAPGSDAMPTRVLQLCELEEDVLSVLILTQSLVIMITLSLTNGNIVLSSPFQKRVIHHLLKTSVVLQKAVPLPN